MGAGMSEPTIYNPSIYNAPTIYNTGANGGGGGGESWRDWYDELERIGYKITTVEFNNNYMASRFNLDCTVVSKHLHIFGSTISTPKLIYIYSNQSGSDDWAPAASIESYLSNHQEVKLDLTQPWQRHPNDPWIGYNWYDGMSLMLETTWNKHGVYIEGVGGHSVECNVNSSWKPKLIQPIRNGTGNSQMYFYYKKIYNAQNELVLNFIPVKRKVDGILGVLETFTGLFSTGSNLSE